MSKAVTVTTGYHLVAPVRLKKGDDNAASTFSIDPGATVKAAIVDTERSTIVAGPVTCSNTETGSDWDNSLIIVRMSDVITSAITIEGPAILEISVDDGDKLPWSLNAKIVKGLI